MKKLLFFIVMLLFVVPNFVEAKTLNDMYNELAKLQTEYNNNKNNKNLTQAQINQISTEINNINSTITKFRAEIKQAEADIKTSKEKTKREGHSLEMNDSYCEEFVEDEFVE